MKIAVAGCGIVGASVSGLLAKAGHEVTVFEQAPECMEKGAGILLQPNGQRLVERMGLLPELEACSEKLSGLTGYRASRKPLFDFRYERLSPDLYGLGVHRGRLFTLLYRWCLEQGVRVVTNTRIESYTVQNNNHVMVNSVCEKANEERFDFLIATDGSRSVLRGQSELPVRVKESDYGAIILSRQSDFQPGYLFQVFQGTKRLIGLLPIGNNEASYFWGLKTDTFDSLKSSDFSSWKQQAIELVPESEAVLRQVESFDEFLFAKFRHVTMKRPYGDRIVFLGDSAHAISPHLGQGVSLGLEDAAVFVDLLNQSGDFSDACVEYHQHRRKRIRFYQQLAKLLHPFFQAQGMSRGVLRDWTLPWISRIPFFRTMFLRILSGEKNGWLS